MATATALKNQIEAVKARIDAVAPTATPEDVVMLAKAIEAVGGQATVFDVMEAGAEQKTALAATAERQKTNLNDTAREGIAAIKEMADERYALFEQDIAQIGAFAPPVPDGAGKEGLVPAPAAGSNRNVLTADGWKSPAAPVGMLAAMPADWADDGWVRLTSSAQTARIKDYPLLAALQGRKRNKLNSLNGSTPISAAGTLTSESPIFFNRETREFAVTQAAGILTSADGLFFKATTEVPVSGEGNFAIAQGVVLLRKKVNDTQDDFILCADGTSSPIRDDSAFTKSGVYSSVCAVGDVLYAVVAYAKDDHALWRIDAKTKAVTKVNLPFSTAYQPSLVAGGDGVCVVQSQGLVCVRHDASTASPLLMGSFSRSGTRNGSGWDTVQTDRVQYLNDRFVAVDGNSRKLSVSTDLRSWDTFALSDYGSFQSMFFHEGNYYLTFARAVLSGEALDALTVYVLPAEVNSTATVFSGLFCLRGTFLAIADKAMFYRTPEKVWAPLNYSDATTQKGQIAFSSPPSGHFYSCERQGIALYKGYLIDADCPYERNNNSSLGESSAPGTHPEYVFFLDDGMYYVTGTSLRRCPYYNYDPDTEFLLPSASASGYSVNTCYNSTANCPIFMRYK